MVSEIEQSASHRVQPYRLSTAFVRTLVQIIDSTVILTVGFGSYFVYVIFIVGGDLSSQYFVSIGLGAVIACIMFHSFGIYEEAHLASQIHATKRLLSAWAITFAILLSAAFALKISDYYSRIWGVTWFSGTGSLLLVARLCLGGWIRQRAREGVLGERSVIFGAGEIGQRFAAQICDLKDPFINIVGFIDDRATRVPRSSNGFELLGDSDTLLNLIRANLVDQVFIALPWIARGRLQELIRQLELTPVRVSLVSEPLGFDIPVRAIKYINNAPTLQLIHYPLSGWSNLIKWIEDRFLSLLIMIFISPLMVFIAIAIKLDSPGRVFFKQRRYGFNNNDQVNRNALRKHT